MQVAPVVDHEPPRDPWPRVLLFSVFMGAVYCGVLSAIGFVLNAVALDSMTMSDPLGGAHRLGLPRDLTWFLIGAGVTCCVAAAIGAILARRAWRRDRRKLAWGFLIAIPFSGVVGVPVGVASLGVGLATSAVAQAVLPSENYVSLQNDTSRTVQVRYCVEQDCTGANGDDEAGPIDVPVSEADSETC